MGTSLDELIRSFKMLLLPTGGAVRIPHCPGNYVVAKYFWSEVTFPCWGQFNDNLRRKEELAVAVLDYSRVHPNMELISIESLAHPLPIRNNVYKSHKELRITSISNVKSFRDVLQCIDEVGVVGPWSEHFVPFKQLKINMSSGARRSARIATGLFVTACQPYLLSRMQRPRPAQKNLVGWISRCAIGGWPCGWRILAS
eukprot:6213843-Pleurochrysis_carterae.AAC.2